MPLLRYRRYRPNHAAVHVPGGGGGPSAEVSQFLSRTSGLDGTHTTAYTTLIDGLVADGVWTKLDVLYIFATDTTTNALKNLKSSSYTAALLSTPTFTADQGYTMSNGGGSLLNSTFVPSTAGGNYTLNSASFGFYQRSAGTAGYNSPSMGGNDVGNANQTLLFTLNAGSDVYGRINQSFGGSFGTLASPVDGFWQVSRTGASTLNMSKDGSAFGTTQSDASTALTGVALYIGTSNNNGTIESNLKPDQFAAAYIGGGLTNTEMTALSNRVNTYMTAVGANVY